MSELLAVLLKKANTTSECAPAFMDTTNHAIRQGRLCMNYSHVLENVVVQKVDEFNAIPDTSNSLLHEIIALSDIPEVGLAIAKLVKNRIAQIRKKDAVAASMMVHAAILSTHVEGLIENLDIDGSDEEKQSLRSFFTNTENTMENTFTTTKLQWWFYTVFGIHRGIDAVEAFATMLEYKKTVESLCA